MTNEELYNALVNDLDIGLGGIGSRLDKLNENLRTVINTQHQIIHSMDRVINTIDRVLVTLD